MTIAGFWFHRLEQWDLDCFPLLCVHRKTANACARVFCLWSRGIQVGRHIIVWKRIGRTNNDAPPQQR
jgi:hypothetical protein